MKRLCAKAALDLVPDHGIIGLGGGETISYLAEDIKEAGKDVKVVTPSDHTAQVCRKLGLEIIDTKEVKEIEIAFDGCDQVDSDLNAYKSGGGIHTLEKIIAKMAKEYVLLVDETKVTDKLNNKVYDLSGKEIGDYSKDTINKVLDNATRETYKYIKDGNSYKLDSVK